MKGQQTDFPNLRPPWGLKEIVAIILCVYFSGATLSLSYRFIHFPVSDVVLFFLSGLFQALVLTLLTLFVVLRKYRASLSYLGLGRYSLRVILRSGILGGFGILILVVLATAVESAYLPGPPSPQPFAELVLMARSAGELLVLLLLGGVVAPLGEEIYFRGFVYPFFRGSLGFAPALLLSSAFFAVLHFDPVRFFPLFAGGAGLVLLAERTRSLWPVIIAHGLWNVSMILFVYFSRCWL